MKFWEIFRFELSYQLRRPWPWLIITILMLLVFLFMRDGSFSEALYTEFFINSPFMVAMATVFGSLLWLVTSAFVAGEAASRDESTGMYPMIFTAPITKLEYLGGRFVASLLLNAVVLLSVQLTIILAIYLPGVHPDSLGPFRPAAFINAYCFIALPNAFAATSVQFAVASRTGKPMSAYVASLALFFTAFFIASLILFRSGLGTLLDPIGVRFVWDELSHQWTTVEKSVRLLVLEGPILQNRLLWTCVGIGATILTYLHFQFSHRTNQNWWSKIFLRLSLRKESIETAARTLSREVAPIDATRLADISSRRTFGLVFHVKQIVTIGWSTFRNMATTWPGLAMLILIPLMAIPVIIDQMISLGLALTPTTSRVISELTGPVAGDLSRWMVIPGFIIYFTGEAIWRERDFRLNEINDIMPGSEWSSILGKFLGIAILLIVFLIMLSGAAIFTQVILEFQPASYANEMVLYGKMMFGLQLPEYLLFAVLTLFIHTAVNEKYIGHLVAVIAYAFIAAVAGMLGIEHNLLIYGAGPNWYYTEMREFGASIGPWLWFKLYWFAWALLLFVGAMVFWVRGKENGLGVRLRLARQRFAAQAIPVTCVALLLIAVIGGYIFYNTNVLNQYTSSWQSGEWRATYERLYGRYENSPQPELSGTRLRVEIYPEKRAVDISGVYQLSNRSGVDIDSIHVSTSISGGVTKSVLFDRKAKLVVDDTEHRYQIYVLDDPLKPGDTIQLNFEVGVSLRGFRNAGHDRLLDAKGSHFTNLDWFPSVGYQRTRSLINPAQRREHGLGERPVIASLYQAHEGEPISLGSGVMFDAVMGTSESQVAIAPGNLVRSWKENGRSYYHYSTSNPIGSEWSFFSGNYQVYEREFKSAVATDRPVVVKIYHYPRHTAHLKGMMRSVLSSLAYNGEQFGNYPYSHLTIVEHPGAPGTGMHADASMIYYGQSYPHWIPENENALDFPYAVMGHEMGHQWTLPYAFVEGLPFLSEGIAWYYGMMMVKATRGPVQTRKLLSFMRQPYPHQPIRRGEPLLRAVDPYLAYKRGPLAMFALAEYAGSDNVNRAIRRLNERSDSVGAAPVTTLDLYRELQAVTSDSLQPMLHDIFEVNTLWSFETVSGNAVKVGEAKWEVTLDITARKIVYDSAGVETDVPMSYEWIPVGVFANQQPGQDELSTPLYLVKHRIRAGAQTIKVIVSQEPILAGIDPHHLLDWEEKEDDDNIISLSKAGS